MFKKFFYIIAAILIIIWAVGFFIYAVGAIVHLLLIAAVLLIIFRVARGSRRNTPRNHIDKYTGKY
jgi:Flp pilus assembly protein TadB